MLLESQQMVTMLLSTPECIGVSGHNFIAYVIICAIIILLMLFLYHYIHIFMYLYLCIQL